MEKNDVIEASGVVLESLPNASFKVKLDSGHEILASLCGKMRVRSINVMPGDEVTVELSIYDLTKGRITYRKTPTRFNK